ncbi:MAG TPA: hypothetical protein VM577_16645, partial [Anaerovoracaceae bacterium]|nr:hypothetical protein [Anaerovoracaceae bacterium]
VLCEIDHELAIMDLKNARKPKQRQYVQDYFLQGTFYAAAVFELTGQKVKRIVFPIVSPEGLQLFECKPFEHFDELLTRIKDYYANYFDPNKTLDISSHEQSAR